MENRKDFIKKNQNEDLSIFKLHEKLNELNIEHEFIDRFKEIRNIIDDKKELDNISEFHTFDYQILIKENNKEISLVQSNFSYGITENMIEIYNFVDEPIVSDYKHIAELIRINKLNKYIIAVNALIEIDAEFGKI